MVTITDKAAAQIKTLLAESTEPYEGLRIYVKGGGCSGYSYAMSFDSAKDDDTVVEIVGVKVIIDPMSAPMLQGSEVDYNDGLNGSGFAIKNPQAKTTCGCGSSFSV